MLFQIIYLYYIIWNSLSCYQAPCMLFVLCYLNFLCLIFFSLWDSGDSSYIQIWQHHLQLTFLISVPSFSTKKVSNVSFSFTSLKELLGKNARCQISSPYRRCRSQVSIFISIGKDLEVVAFQMIDLSHYWNSSFY